MMLMALCLLPLSACTSLFFFPMQQHVTTPAALGFEYEDVWLESSDSTQLHGWLITPEQQIIGTVYFLHGNAENVSTHFRAILWLVNAGYQVFALDYRGYGLSQGKPDVPEVFEDIAAGAQWIYQHHNGNTENKDKPIVLFGQSLGASLALKFAQLHDNFNEQFDALITEAAFSRYGHIARHVADQQWIGSAQPGHIFVQPQTRMFGKPFFNLLNRARIGFDPALWAQLIGRGRPSAFHE